MTRLVCILFLLSLAISVTLSLKCSPTACHTVRCAGPGTCKPGEVESPGGYCLCCTVCKKVIGENEYCGSESPIGGVISDTVVCAEGLICRHDKCEKIGE